MGDRDREFGLTQPIIDDPQGFICANCRNTKIEIIKTDNGVLVYCPRCGNCIEAVWDDNPR